VDPSLPLISGFQFHGRQKGGSLFHGAIADTEPDGWGKRIILRDFSAASPFQFSSTMLTTICETMGSCIPGMGSGAFLLPST
jgi:hypothetical protein